MRYLYICKKKDRLYTGMTTNLNHRMRQHQQAALLYIEFFKEKHKAALRERQIKGWRKDKKLSLIHRADKQVSLP